MDIYLNIENKTNFIFKFEKQFIEILSLVEKNLKIDKKIQIDLMLTNSKEVQKMNKKYRNNDKTTDVLSFPFDDANFFQFLPYIPLGQIVFNVEKVIEQSNEFNHSLEREFCYLFTHAVLHLNGFDHIDENEEKEMNKKTEQIMKQLNVHR